MESHLQDLLPEACSSPRHFVVDHWYERPVKSGAATQISYDPSKQDDDEAFKRRKASRRLERWWHKPIDTDYQTAPSSGKLMEAKRQRFTPEGKQERIAKALAALNQPSNIQLTLEEWRQIVEDPDLEDQS